MRTYLTLCSILLVIGCHEMRGGSLGKLPSVELLLLDSLTHVNTGDVKEGKPVALLYFSPDCEHCQNETRSILDHMDSLREVKFYFITNDSLDKLRIFRSIFRLDKYSNITLGWDNQFLFPRQFKGAYPPYLALYDRQLKQVGVFNGEVEASKIIALINN